MKFNFKDFIKGQGAIASIFMGVFYAVCMLGIFLGGYTAIPGNMDRLPVAIVNDDKGEYGKQISESLLKELPFDNIDTKISNKEAMEQLGDNELALVIHIPSTFSADMQNSEVSSNIDFTTNEASATASSSAMVQVANTINDQLTEQFSSQTAVGVLQGLKIPEEQAKAMAETIQHGYEGNVKVINDVPAGMHNNMLPMFLTMALYVGAMIAAMQLTGNMKLNRGKASKTKLFTYMQLTALIIGVIAGGISAGIAFAVNDINNDLFFQVWGQQILVYWACFNFTAIWVLLIGEGGMIINIPILLVQTIANGATIPREMMYAPFQWASHITPMYYSVQAYFANLFGSAATWPYIVGLVAVGVGAMLINILIVWLLHRKLPVETATKAEPEAVAKAQEKELVHQ